MIPDRIAMSRSFGSAPPGVAARDVAPHSTPDLFKAE
jgi:hypothetical protein